MNVSTVKQRLKDKNEKTVRKALSYLHSKSGDRAYLSQYEHELESLNHPHYRDTAHELLLLIPNRPWYKSFYEVRDDFYDAIDIAIRNIVDHINKDLQRKHYEGDITVRIKKFISHLGHRELSSGIHMADYVNLSTKEEIRPMLGSHYECILRGLKSHKIIEVRKDYSSDLKYSRGYRVHRKWIKLSKNECEPDELDDVFQGSDEVLRKMTIDYSAAMKAIQLYVDVKLDNEIIPIDDRTPLIHKGMISRVELLVASPNGKDKTLKTFYNYPVNKLDEQYGGKLFYHKNKIIGSSRTQYLRWKARNIANSYTRSVVSILDIENHLSYSEDGRRIYTKIVQIPKLLIPYLKIDGDTLEERDLANCQWRLLVHCLEHTEMNNIVSIYAREFGTSFTSKTDYAEAKEAICSGRFYQHIQERIYGDTLMNYFFAGQSIDKIPKHRLEKMMKSATKSLTFLVLFSGHEFNPPIKEEFRKEFPSIAKICDDIKNPHIYNQLFPIWEAENREYFTKVYGGIKPLDKEVYKELPKELQRVEGYIMINTILNKLHDNGIDALSKHDAILIPSKQLDIAEGIIHNELYTILGKDTYLIR